VRQALFAVVLVGASFGGGAAVNGPGLRWAREAVLSRLGMADSPEPAPPRSTAAMAVEPTIKSEGTSPTLSPDPTPGRAVADELPGLAPVPEEAPTPPPLEPPDPPRSVTRHDEPVRDRSVRRVSRVETPATPEPEPEPAAPGPAAGGGDGPGDWASVRRAMRDLGVSRYGVEGEPGGVARFHCVIPLAGRRAVGQHFEAEGPDDLQAAKAALRRVALWRATEGAGAPPAP